MPTLYGLLFFAGLVAVALFIRWARSPVIHDVTVLVPRSLPSLRGADSYLTHRDPGDESDALAEIDRVLDGYEEARDIGVSDEAWTNEALDRLADLLEGPDEHEEAGIG